MGRAASVFARRPAKEQPGGFRSSVRFCPGPRSARPRRQALLFALAAGITLVCASLDPGGLSIRLNALIVPALAWLIYPAARFEQSRPFRGQSLPARGLVHLGASSYCFFLAQLVPLMFLDSAGGRALDQRYLGNRSNAALWIGIFLVALIGAVLRHELVEKPARRALLKRWERRPS